MGIPLCRSFPTWREALSRGGWVQRQAEAWISLRACACGDNNGSFRLTSYTHVGPEQDAATMDDGNRQAGSGQAISRLRQKQREPGLAPHAAR